MSCIAVPVPFFLYALILLWIGAIIGYLTCALLSMNRD
jgi:hypothetical protein